MRVLFDSHALVWFLLGDRRFPLRLRQSLEAPETEFMISAASMWEIATKVRRGRWPEAEAVMANLDRVLAASAYVPLSISIAHARTAASFGWQPQDPFDRILAAQAQIEGVPLLSADPVFRAVGVAVMW
jgi:PIN domain nuclease of toxin-antitoxin system